MHKIDIYNNISAYFKILGYAPGLAFTGEAGVSDVSIFQTLVRGFGKILGDVYLSFRNTLVGFRN
jgi:hypothetical protein